MNEKAKDFRNKITEMFLQALEKKEKDWSRPWAITLQTNASNNYTYRGINQIYLSLICDQRGYTDPRWATFIQAQQMGWKIKRGAKGAKIEYWFPYDLKQKKSIPWQQYKECTESEKENIVIRPVYKYVFNAQDIEGIPERRPSTSEIVPLKIIEKISCSMGVSIHYDELNSAYYMPGNDSIHLPPLHNFKSESAYAATSLHELAHSTGAFQRLNRPLGHNSGSVQYAYEELIAEITSAYMSANLNLPYDESQMENHQAYIQSWISGIREKPDMLMAAVKEAESASDYLEYHAGIIDREEFLNRRVDITLKTVDRLVHEMEAHSYPSTSQTKALVRKLAEAAPGIHNLKDLHHAYKNQLKKFPMDTQNTIVQLGDTLKNIELSRFMECIPE